MPIADDMKEHYPDDWDEIRERVLERATIHNGRLGLKLPSCERCGAPHREEIIRKGEGRYELVQRPPKGSDLGIYFAHEFDVDGEFRCTHERIGSAPDDTTTVTLTIAHLCHDPRCDNLDHLRALCQRCHLTYDAQPEQRAKRERIQAELRGQQTIVPEAGCECVVGARTGSKGEAS